MFVRISLNRKHHEDAKKHNEHILMAPRVDITIRDVKQT
jgi:hypothetical protein